MLSLMITMVSEIPFFLPIWAISNYPDPSFSLGIHNIYASAMVLASKGPAIT